MLGSDWAKVGSTQPRGFCFYKPLTDAMWRRILKIPGTDLALPIVLASIYLIKIASDLAQKLWYYLFLTHGINSVPLL